MQPHNQQVPGSGTPKGIKPEMSQIQELSQSVLFNDQQISEFNKKRGFLNLNRLLHAPMFNPSAHNSQAVYQDKMSSSLNGNMAGPDASNTQVIWGTNINQSEIQIKMKNFINTFVYLSENEEDFTKPPHYIQLLRLIMETELYVLDINCDHIYQYDQVLYKQLENYPSDVIPMFDLVVTACYKEHCLNIMGGGGQNNQNNSADQNMGRGASGMGGSSGIGMGMTEQEDPTGRGDVIIQVRPFNLKKLYQIRELDPTHIDKLITIKGIVIRNSDVIPEMKQACFKCQKCYANELAYVVMGKIQEPDVCRNCKTRQSFLLVHNQSMFSDKQHVKLQETPESVPEGETPQTIHLCAYEDLVDYVKPGDRVDIVGIYKAVGIRTNVMMRTLKNVYRTYIDVVNYVKADAKRFNVDTEHKDQEEGDDKTKTGNDETPMDVDQENHMDQALKDEHQMNFTEADITKFRAFAADPMCYDKLVDAFAPSIWENQDVKKGILCQLFGGVSKELTTSGRGRFRGEINILLCGDPSTAKSQLLQYVHKIAPRGIYTSGKGSSAVGLTVYITKDPETRELVLESGALVLSDRGICCIDEFDKMDDNTRVILHEAMEQQTVSVAKAGIICTLNARTAILAAANPIHSKYDPKLSVVENIKLPPTLLSRFDLIYLILDKQNDAHDRRLANHIVSLYSTAPIGAAKQYQQTQLIASNKMEREFFAQYISYARRFVRPSIPDYVVNDFVNEYTKMRSLGNSKKTITATPRQLESMIRISEAVAKMRLSDTVEKKDIDEAVRLIKTAMQQSATDPTTGEIDMDIITTGVSSTSIERIRQIAVIIKKIYQDHKERVKASGVQYYNLLEYVNTKAMESVNVGAKKSQAVNEQEFRDALRQLEEENVISMFGHAKAPTIRFTLE